MSSLLAGVRIQRRVVWALMLRETKTLFGKHKLGYLWAPINAAFSIAVFWFLREFAGFQPPPGLSTPLFLLGGFITWALFSDSVTSSINAISGNKSLLAYPQVFPLDLIISRVLLQGALQVCVMLFLLLVAEFMGYSVPLHDPLGVIIGLVLALLFGFGVGAFCAGLNLLWPTLSRILPMILRVLFFTSGLFFSVEYAPKSARDVLSFNPISHLIEMLRHSLSEGHESTFISPFYVVGFILVTMPLGLLLERYSRRYMDSSK